MGTIYRDKREFSYILLAIDVKIHYSFFIESFMFQLNKERIDDRKTQILTFFF